MHGHRETLEQVFILCFSLIFFIIDEKNWVLLFFLSFVHVISYLISDTYSIACLLLFIGSFVIVYHL